MTAPKCCKKEEIKHFGGENCSCLGAILRGFLLALGADCGWPGQQPLFGGQGRQGGLKRCKSHSCWLELHRAPVTSHSGTIPQSPYPGKVWAALPWGGGTGTIWVLGKGRRLAGIRVPRAISAPSGCGGVKCGAEGARGRRLWALRFLRSHPSPKIAGAGGCCCPEAGLVLSQPSSCGLALPAASPR